MFRTLIIISFSTGVFAQNLQFYRQDRIKRIDSLCSIDTGNKLKWLSLLPSVSASDSGISVNLSASNFIRYVQEKEHIKFRSKDLRSKLINDLDTEIKQASMDILDFNLHYNDIKFSINNASIDKELFDIEEKKYLNHEITYKQFLLAKRSFNLVIRLIEKQIASLEIELLGFKEQYGFQPLNLSTLKNLANDLSKKG